MAAQARQWLRRLLPAILALPLLPLAAGAPPATAAAVQQPADARLYLVTLRGPGVPESGLVGAAARLAALATQDRTLDSVGAGEPEYRWTHALNGYAVRLSAAQAASLASDADVASVEPDTRRRLAGVPGGGTSLPGSPYADARGGRGTVIGLIDSGLAPESPLFASGPDLGRLPERFRGDCESAPGWSEGACTANGKVVAAAHFALGFGEDALASNASLSPRDDTGHGTQVASIAAGNPGVSIDVRGQARGSYSGVAPQARLAVYKACWTAPDPSDDGCSTADLVAAVDRATIDRVDVLNLSVAGVHGYDTLARALLGAAEADIAVVAAAGSDRTVAHPEPWVTTVGATSGTAYVGQVRLSQGPVLAGAMLSGRATDGLRIVRSVDVAAPGTGRAAARTCRPGSLDDRRVQGRVVVCERGGDLGRVDKSLAVKQAGGVGMVLLNGPGRDDVSADLHHVPTVHLRRDDARALLRWLAGHPDSRARLVPLGPTDRAARMLPSSASGDSATSVVKPDLVAPGAGLLGAVPVGVRGTRWDFLTGTSGASAQVAGLAAILRSRHADWAADRVRSVLATSAEPLRARVLRRGAGEAVRAVRPGLAFDVSPGEYRRFLDGQVGRDLNTPSVMFGQAHGSAVRRVTNVSGATRTWVAQARGFSEHDVLVRPATFTLRPGRTVTLRVLATGPEAPHPLEDGVITLRARGTTDVRVPVVLSR